MIPAQWSYASGVLASPSSCASSFAMAASACVTMMPSSSARISKSAQGRSAPPLGFLTRIASDSGKSVDWVLMGKG